MNRRALALLLAVVSAPAYADDKAQADAAATAQIRAIYQKQFPGLPLMRACMPQDAVGIWSEVAALQSQGRTALDEREKQGPRYVMFAPNYNQFHSFRRMGKVDVASAAKDAAASKSQFIATAAGMLFIYENGQLAASYVCSVATAAKDNIAAGTLMLANPPEKNKPLIATLYLPYNP